VKEETLNLTSATNLKDINNLIGVQIKLPDIPLSNRNMDNSYRAISDAYSYHWALDVAQRRLNSRPAQSVASSLYRYLSINCTNDDKSVNPKWQSLRFVCYFRNGS
jgi:hypothetical protein